ncbi:hypothetical protein ZWY2020_056904 [Hordeum vulgare]|nr:hypothetical protein ZWY2020_056904 [Hordeum vulgare]
MINMIRMRVVGLYPQYIDVDVEYTREDEPPQRAAVLQLCMEELCEVYHMTTTTKWPNDLHPLLKEEKLYTFVSFSIGSDKEILKESGLEINPDKYIDVKGKWTVPLMGG